MYPPPSTPVVVDFLYIYPDFLHEIYGFFCFQEIYYCIMRLREKTVLFAKNFYLQQELHGILDFARAHGWQLEQPQMYGLREHVRNWRGAGLLTDTGFAVQELAAAGVQVVGLSMEPELLQHAHAVVSPDNQAIGCAAAEYFLERGYRHFAVCADCYGRDQSFAARVATDGLAATPLPLPRYHRTPEALHELARALQALPHPCAVFCNNDWEALSVLNAAALAALKIPADLSVVGVGNEPSLCLTASPQLSSLDTRLYERGRLAAAELDRLMEGAPPRDTPLLVAPGTVIERGSSSDYATDLPVLRKMLDHLLRHFSLPIQIADLARRFHCGESTIYRHFMHAFGISPKDFLTNLRFSRACTLLLDTNDTIASIAADCGFASPTALFALFQQRLHTTPDKWRSLSRKT